jgi:hypothetical protein
VPQHQLRDILRYSHIVAGVALGVVVYSPLVDEDWAVWAMRLVLVPFLVIGGAWMLKQSLSWAAGAARAREPS